MAHNKNSNSRKRQARRKVSRLYPLSWRLPCTVTARTSADRFRQVQSEKKIVRFA